VDWLRPEDGRSRGALPADPPRAGEPPGAAKTTLPSGGGSKLRSCSDVGQTAPWDEAGASVPSPITSHCRCRPAGAAGTPGGKSKLRSCSVVGKTVPWEDAGALLPVPVASPGRCRPVDAAGLSSRARAHIPPALTRYPCVVGPWAGPGPETAGAGVGIGGGAWGAAGGGSAAGATTVRATP
jgi:hypothetical protein